MFSQSLDDTLITMGLLRNRNIDASSSATAYREAVRRVGSDARAQQAILGAGIQVFDQTTGRMRSIVDIMSDFSAATTTMTEEERNRRVATAFGDDENVTRTSSLIGANDQLPSAEGSSVFRSGM